MNYMKQTSASALLVLFLLFSFCINTFAQSEEDFPKLARRSMKDYETKLKGLTPYDSIAWHGGVYLGNSSRGRIMPNGFFSFKHGKWALTGDLSVDASKIRTFKDEEDSDINGHSKQTNTETKNHYEHEDINLHADYHATRQHTLSLDFFQKYHHDRINDNSIQSGHNQDDLSLPMVYEDQARAIKDFNFGILAEHTYKFRPGGSLATRVYFKYDNKPTDLTSTVWGEDSPKTFGSEHQTFRSADPKAQIVYLSPSWNGFSFGLRQKIGTMNMRIEDSATKFDYDVRESLSSAGVDYKNHIITFSAGGGFEMYHHDIRDHINSDVSHTYHNWIYNATLSCNFFKRNRLTAGFRHDISRPTYTQLYPFVHIGSGIASWVIGNPSLQPSRSDQWQGKYTYVCKPLTLNTILTYKVTKQDITRISAYNEELDRWIKTWVNDARYHTLRLAVEGEVRAGIFSMTMGVHTQWLRYSGQNVRTDDARSFSFKMRPQVKLPHDWTLACVVLCNGRENHRYEYNRSYTYLALRAIKQVGPWGIYAFAQDLLRSDHTKVLRNGEATIVSTNDLNARALVLGCSYSF